MAFRNLSPATGPFFLSPRKSMDVVITFGGDWSMPEGADVGPIWIMASPILEGRPAQVQVSRFRKGIDYQDADAGGDITRYSRPNFYYAVTVTNVTDFPCHFTLEGGGNA